MADELPPNDSPPEIPLSDSGSNGQPELLNIEDELKHSYLRYAMSVIISRALPDVRDGLKPSQRRILLAMNDLNLGPTASTSKCAGIVGETMKRYHPHGDQAIYPTLVRMAQDWNMRHPLIHPQGNFGSIGGQPPAAMRYCVTGDTLVRTVEGTRRIDELAEVEPNSEADVFLEVFNRDGEVVTASKLFHSGDHPTLRLRTKEGFELIGTRNHPVLCLANVNGAPALVWRLLAKVQPGDRVVMFREALDDAQEYLNADVAEFTRIQTKYLNAEVAEFTRIQTKYLNADVAEFARIQTMYLNSCEFSYIRKEEIGASEALTIVEPLVACGYYYATVASIEDAGIQPVYSIRVDAECHSFITNGFISHNTEARLSQVAAEMLEDLERDTVDFIDNYDGKYREPLVLPCKFPNLLVNGSDGIAVGMATEIPPHNLGEVCNALVHLIDHPEATIEELIAIIPGPDYPTGGIICGQQGIYEGYMTGRGKVTLRARAHIEEEGPRNQIIITEVPYQQPRDRLAKTIGDLVKDERIKGIHEIRDESSARQGEPVRIVIDLKRDANPELILNQLYQFSPLQKTVSIILLALVDNRPRTLTLKEMLQEFLRHRVQVIRRRTEYLLREAKRRAHILEGQLIAISSLDEVIQICRSSPSRAEAKLRLQNLEVAAAVLDRALGTEHFQALQREIGEHPTYRMTEAQADAVVRLQLGQLAALERDEILKEYNGLRGQIISYEELLSTEYNILEVIKKDLIELRDKFGNERRTEIIETPLDQLTNEDLIPEETNVVTLTHNGYIKRLPLNTYRSQHRGGRGVSAGTTREDDFIEHVFVTSTHAYLLCFTNLGQLYWLKVYQIPEMTRTSAGRAIANVLSLRPEEKISSIIPVREFEKGYYLLMATKNGLVKKTELEAYSRPKRGGIIGINLDPDDSLIGVVLTKEGDEVILSTADGMAIRFAESDARPMGRNTRGVKGISLRRGDEVVGMVVTDPEGYLLTVCENGYGKRTPFGANIYGEEEMDDEANETQARPLGTEPEEETQARPLGTEPEEEMPDEANDEAARDRSAMRYRKQKRGGKGIRDIRTTERNGKVVGVLSVRDGDDIMLVTIGGMINRTHVSEIRIVGRNTQGVRIMDPKEGDKIASLAKVPPEEKEAEEAAASEEGQAEAAGE